MVCKKCTAKTDGYEIPHDAAYDRDLPALKCFIDHQGFDVNARDRYGETPLHDAVRGKSLEAIRFLLERGADVLAKCHLGSIPLHKAAIHPRLEIVKCLLTHQNKGKKQALTYSNNNESALHSAAGHSHGLEMVKLLVAYGADVTIKATSVHGDDRTPSQIARARGLSETADYLDQVALILKEKQALQEVLGPGESPSRTVKRAKSL